MSNASETESLISTASVANALAAYEAGRLDEAAEACAVMLRANSGNFDALHLFGMVMLAKGDANEAVRLITAAVKLRPRSDEAAFNLGLALQGAGDPNGALAQYDRALALRPRVPATLNNRGNALRALGRFEEALAGYEAALAQELDYPEALSNRAAVLLDLGRPEEALTSCQQAISVRPDFAEAHFNRGNVLSALGRHQRALASYDDALRCDPTYGAALVNKSAIFTQLHRYDEALAAAKAAIAVHPRHVDALINCGVAAQHLGRLADAISAYDEVLAVAPKSITALRNRGAALRTLGRHAEALANFDRLIAVGATDVEALCGRGEALRALGRHAEALAMFEQVLALEPGHGTALGGAAFAALNICEWTKVRRLTAELLPRVEAGMVVSPFILLNLTDSARLHASGVKSYVQNQIKSPALPFRRDPPRRTDKVRIAYMSGDFRRHPVAQLTAELFEQHDRARFEVIGVSYGPGDGSELRARIVGAFDSFHDVTAMNDHDAARLIHDMRTDILVDLTGYTAGSRPQVLAWRPAPVAVNYLGYPGTMGATFIDYILADRIVLPLDQQPFYTEKIVHLPNSFQPNDSRRKIAAETPTRAAAGLPETGLVFCCFNKPYKIAAPVFEAWMRLLKAVDASVLWLAEANDTATANLRAAATAAGVSASRLIFAPKVEQPDAHLARHRLADLFLDTLPYNAHATASDALWAGLPVVTCAGSAFAGRVGASLLTAIDLPDLIAPDLAAYEALALRLAKEPAALAECKRRLEEKRLPSPLFATDRLVRNLEAAYLRMHAVWRSGKPVKGFAIQAD